MDMGNTDLGSQPGKQGNRGVMGNGYKIQQPNPNSFTPGYKYGVNPAQRTETDVSGWGKLSARMTSSYTPFKRFGLRHATSDLQAGGKGRTSWLPVESPSGIVPQIGEF